ncbi:MAG: MFS transporter [Rickettsia endosymbiont of Ixodes persulcatus]|nr:MFS transporter [Rickettsia endosymbiont of Ixodes persulcatus]
MEYTNTLTLTKKILWVFPLCLIFYELPLYFAINMYLPALPEMSQAFGIKANLAQLTIAIWFFGASCFQVFLGPLADRFGYRKVLLNGGIFFIVACLICALTHHITLFLVARFIQGSVVSSILVAGYATIHEILDTEQAIKTLSWMGSITVLSPAIGPLLGTFFIKIIGWQNIFFFLATLAAIALYLLYLYMPKSEQKKQSLRIKPILINYRTVILSKKFVFFLRV